MSFPPEKIGDKGQRYEISYILPDGSECRLGWANDPDAFKDAAAAWPKLKGATRKVTDRQPGKCPVCDGHGELRHMQGGSAYQLKTCHRCGGKGTVPVEPPEDPVTTRAKEIYLLAWKRAAGIVAVYQVRNYPRTRVQAIPAYKNEADYEFFKDMTGDCDVIELTFPEWEIYLVAFEKILLDEHGITAQRRLLTQHELRDFVTEAESGQ